MCISTARVWHSQQPFIKDFPGKKDLPEYTLLPYSAREGEKKPQTLGTKVPRNSSTKAATGWVTPGKQNFVTHLLLQLKMSFIGLWKWWTSNHFSMALDILSSCSESFCPAEWGWPVHLQGGLSALFKQPELTGEWKPQPPSSNSVEKVLCRAGSFVFLFALSFARQGQREAGSAWWFWWRIKTETHLTALIL